jgi:hypothetical protein
LAKADEVEICLAHPDLAAGCKQLEPAAREFGSALAILARGDAAIVADWLDDAGLPSNAVRAMVDKLRQPASV